MERQVEERGWTIADDGEEERGTMTRSRTEGGMSFCLILILNEKLKKIGYRVDCTFLNLFR